jgi:hypothetical protein
MQTETQTPAHRHSWWWVVTLPVLLVIYVLGMAPLNTWTSLHTENGFPPEWFGTVDAPLFWAEGQSQTLAHWTLRYQRWWDRTLGLERYID